MVPVNSGTVFFLEIFRAFVQRLASGSPPGYITIMEAAEIRQSLVTARRREDAARLRGNAWVASYWRGWADALEWALESLALAQNGGSKS